MAVIKRKLYRRGSSYETTIPMPLLFALDLSKRHNVIFSFDPHAKRWYVDFEFAGECKEVSKKRGKA
jgi:hypothetical protein